MERFKLEKEEKAKMYKKRKVHIVLSQSYSVYLFGIIIAIILDFIYPIEFVNKTLAYIGIFLLVIGTMLTYWAQGSASKSKKDMIEKKCSRNFATGPYKFSRRPTQIGLTLATLGFGLVSGSFFVILATIFAYFITRFIFLPHQERILMEQYGDAYCDYHKKVKSIL